MQISDSSIGPTQITPLNFSSFLVKILLNLVISHDFLSFFDKLKYTFPVMRYVIHCLVYNARFRITLSLIMIAREVINHTQCQLRLSQNVVIDISLKESCIQCLIDKFWLIEK